MQGQLEIANSAERQELLLGSEDHISATSDVFTHEVGAFDTRVEGVTFDETACCCSPLLVAV